MHKTVITYPEVYLNSIFSPARNFAFISLCAVLSHSVVSNSLHAVDCSPSGSSVHDGSPGRNTGVDSLSLLQRIFPTWELNWVLLHCKQIFYQLSQVRTFQKRKAPSKTGQEISLRFSEGTIPNVEVEIPVREKKYFC